MIMVLLLCLNWRQSNVVEFGRHTSQVIVEDLLAKSRSARLAMSWAQRPQKEGQGFESCKCQCQALLAELEDSEELSKE